MGVALVLALSKKRRNLELLADLLEDVSTEVSVATEVDEFEALLTEHGEISMAVIDIDGFTRDIWDRSERLREAGIPVLVLTMSAPSDIREEAMRHGAQRILEKPIEKATLRATVRTLAN
ncbi:response regulator [Haloarcula limicola]|nr:response regulator [Halomicroarcula limicola]